MTLCCLVTFDHLSSQLIYQVRSFILVFRQQIFGWLYHLQYCDPGQNAIIYNASNIIQFFLLIIIQFFLLAQANLNTIWNKIRNLKRTLRLNVIFSVIWSKFTVRYETKLVIWRTMQVFPAIWIEKTIP